MRDISTRNQTQITAPSLTTRAMADLIGKFTNRLEDKPGDFRRKLLSASAVPVGSELQELQSRRAELLHCLTPTPDEDAKDVIYGILAGGNTFGMSQRETDLKVGIYAEALAKHPTWAIEAARRIFAKGGWKCSWDGNGVPSSASVNAECSFLTLEIDAEIHKISQILDAEIVDADTTADERAENVAKLAKLMADLRNVVPANERLMRQAVAEKADTILNAQRVASDLAERASRRQAGNDDHPQEAAP